MSVSSRAAVRALPLVRPGLSRRADWAFQRCCGTSILVPRRAQRIGQHPSSQGAAARQSWAAGGSRWYSTDGRDGAESVSSESSISSRAGSVSGESVASSATSLGGRKEPQFAFAFDIDGVLLHSSEPIPGATETLKYLQQHRIPFILLTNGGGKTEADRVADLSTKLGVSLDVSNFVQSHTPYQRLLDPEADLGYPDLAAYLRRSVGRSRLSGADDTVLVLGSDASKARRIARSYGFKSVVTPADILRACPEVFPFDPLREFYAKQEVLPLPKPVFKPSAGAANKLEDCLKIDAIMLFNDPRDWAVDIQLVTDLLLSHAGYLGTYSRRNGDQSAPEGERWQGDGQPALIFSNADLLWSTGYHLSRLGQGSFRAAVRSVWDRLVANAGSRPSPLRYFTFGKPELPTYWHAWDVLRSYHQQQQQQEGPVQGRPGADGDGGSPVLRKVHMVGDNPESDIRGVYNWNLCLGERTEKEKRESPAPEWASYLVRTGVWAEDKMPLDKIDEASRPHHVTNDVRAAVNLALEQEGWAGRVE